MRSNFLIPLLFVAVAEGVDHAFPHGHADLQAVVIVESGGPGDALGDAFGEVDAVEQRLHDHFDAIGITGHEIMNPRKAHMFQDSAFCRLDNSRTTQGSAIANKTGGVCPRMQAGERGGHTGAKRFNPYR